MIKKVLVVGGANGIGLAIAQELASRKETEKVYVVDKAPLRCSIRMKKYSPGSSI